MALAAMHGIPICGTVTSGASNAAVVARGTSMPREAEIASWTSMGLVSSPPIVGVCSGARERLSLLRRQCVEILAP
jgi:hypothetical protein